MSKFCPLYSSSRGNCVYISGSGGAILIDAGVSAKKIQEALNDVSADVSDIRAIFVTHEHTDHISGLRVFASRHNIKVYASEGTLDYLEQNCMANVTYKAEVISSEGVEVAGMFIKPFRTPHDAAESVCYSIQLPDGRKVAVATDIGHVTDNVLDAVRHCDLVMLESNHDVRMLQSGPYPYSLKRRILSGMGHLSNESCASVLPELIDSGTTHFFLAHLSQENNIPQLAFETSNSSLCGVGAERGKDYLLEVAAPSGNHLTIF